MRSYRHNMVPTFRGTVDDLKRELGGEVPARDDSPPPPARRYVPPIERPIGQKIILLRFHSMMVRGDGLASKVLNHTAEWGTESPTQDDAAALLQAGYTMHWKGGYRLTPPGLTAAQEIARDLAKKIGIHHTYRRPATGSTGPQVRCICGWMAYSSIHNAGSLDRHETEHLDQVAQGTLPEAYRIGATIPSTKG